MHLLIHEKLIPYLLAIIPVLLYHVFAQKGACSTDGKPLALPLCW